MQEYLLNSGVKQDQIIAINFESLKFQEMNYKELYEYVNNRIPPTKKLIYFLMNCKELKNGKML